MVQTTRPAAPVETRLRIASLLIGGGLLLLGPATLTERAHAGGEARTLTFFHTHTKESATITYWRDGQYDGEALKRLNWLVRDWRVEEPAAMDPFLFDVLWEIYRASGSREPINIISAYRSPSTNAMLRRRSKAVSEQSQHMLGKAMDIRLPDVDTARLRAVAMKMQYGGVGFYPTAAFVHVDTGSVRAWPRMSQDQLARLFPDGKTVHLPAQGKPLPGYEEAKAEILARNRTLASTAAAPNPVARLLASLFGSGSDGASTAQQPDSAIRTASLPSGAALAALSAAVPIPPPRPPGAASELPGFAPAAEPVAPLYATVTSRLLFSGVPMTRQRAGDLGTAFTVEVPLAPAAPAGTDAPLMQRFRQGLITAGEGRFVPRRQGSAPVWMADAKP